MSNPTPAAAVPAASKFFAVTPSDTADLAPMALALYVGTGGDIVAQDPDGNEVTFSNVPQGAILPGRFRRVLNTSTTASNLIGYA